MRAIDRAWSEAGVAILVDLGGAETNSEMAIEMLDAARRDKVVVCEAPVVEGAVMAATEASGGATLEAVRRTAEELSPDMNDSQPEQSSVSDAALTRLRTARQRRRPARAALREAHSVREALRREHRIRAAMRTGPWVDAKSPVKVMRVKAAKGETLHFRVRGSDAAEALAALARAGRTGLRDRRRWRSADDGTDDGKAV